MMTVAWILIALLLLLLLYAWLIHPQLPRRDISPLQGRDYAHRGLWNAERPENSLAAFTAAVDGGYGIELDVHLTRDGCLVVHHDSSLKRICGADIVIEKSDLAQLRACRLRQTDEPVPTFDEVLALVDGKVPLIVELKAADGNSAVLAKAVYERMQRYGGPWCMESFQPSAVQWFRKNAPDVIRGQLAYNHAGKGDTLSRRLLNVGIASMVQNFFARPDFIAYEAVSESPRSLPMNILRRMRPWLVCWTIRSQADMDKFRSRFDLQIFEGFIPKS